MQIVSRLLAFTLDRWCSHRAAATRGQKSQKEQIVTYTPLEVEGTPLVKIGYEPFILHCILPTSLSARDTQSENSSELSQWSFEEDGKDLPQLPT